MSSRSSSFPTVARTLRLSAFRSCATTSALASSTCMTRSLPTGLPRAFCSTSAATRAARWMARPARSPSSFPTFPCFRCFTPDSHRRGTQHPRQRAPSLPRTARRAGRWRDRERRRNDCRRARPLPSRRAARPADVREGLRAGVLRGRRGRRSSPADDAPLHPSRRLAGAAPRSRSRSAPQLPRVSEHEADVSGTLAGVQGPDVRVRSPGAPAWPTPSGRLGPCRERVSARRSKRPHACLPGLFVMISARKAAGGATARPRALAEN